MPLGAWAAHNVVEMYDAYACASIQSESLRTLLRQSLVFGGMATVFYAERMGNGDSGCLPHLPNCNVQQEI